MLFLFNLFRSEILEACTLPESTGYMLTKYYKPLCPHSLKIEEIIDEIDSTLERNSIDLRMNYVDCDTCDCIGMKIVHLPTVILSKDGIQIEKLEGENLYDDYTRLLTEKMNIPEEIFYKHVKNVPGKLVKLKEMDFDDGFEGPWLVLFNSEFDKKTRKLFEKLAVEFKNQVNFGEIESKRTKKIRTKVNIQQDPTILALYRGVVASFENNRNHVELSKFINKLTEPSFRLIDINMFKEEVKKLKRGEPIFIVFFSNLTLANMYFKRIAHEYKFKSKFFKTNDKYLFERASIFPKKPNELESITDNDQVILSVYKDNTFHQCPYKLEEVQKVPTWIFHSHFPHLTRITNENFGAVFHGLKPVLLLITRDDDYITIFERFSTYKQTGTPFHDFLFATINVDLFPHFLSNLLPTINQPAIVIYNPQKQKFFVTNNKVDKERFENQLENILRDYEMNRLQEYPPKKTYKYKLVVLGVILLVIGFLTKLISRKKVRKD